MADLTFNIENMNISKMKVSDLKRELRTRGLNASGNKTELVERLTEALQNGKNDDGSADSVDELIDDDDVLNDDEIEQEVGNMKSIESEVSDKSFETDSTTTHNKPTKRKSFEVTNNNGTSEAKPAKKIVLNRTSSAEAHTEELTDTTTLVPTITTTTTAPAATEAATSAVVMTSDSEAEKKVIKLSELNAKQRLEMRAKKFGVALSSDAKKEVRAQRFGPNSTATSAAAAGRTTITINNSPTAGGPNMDLLKRRAERFGTVSTQLIKVETQEKLEKRKARFGEPAAAAAVTNGESSDVQKAKRLERFKTSVK